MPFANHFLGAIARLNATLWWHRVSGVPLRVVLVFYLAVWGAELWKSALGARHNAKSPLEVSVERCGDRPKIAELCSNVRPAGAGGAIQLRIPVEVGH